MSNTAELKKALARRATINAKLEALKAEMSEIDATIKASLDYAEDPYIIGNYKVYWKETTRTSLDQSFLKAHEPAAYARALVTKTTTYYAVK